MKFTFCAVDTNIDVVGDGMWLIKLFVIFSTYSVCRSNVVFHFASSLPEGAWSQKLAPFLKPNIATYFWCHFKILITNFPHSNHWKLRWPSWLWCIFPSIITEVRANRRRKVANETLFWLRIHSEINLCVDGSCSNQNQKSKFWVVKLTYYDRHSENRFWFSILCVFGVRTAVLLWHASECKKVTPHPG